MRKSERLRQLELAVVRMEMHMELIALSISNLLDSQGMDATPPLENGKWYKRPTDTP
jgi:hypothetical protein